MGQLGWVNWSYNDRLRQVVSRRRNRFSHLTGRGPFPQKPIAGAPAYAEKALFSGVGVVHGGYPEISQDKCPVQSPVPLFLYPKPETVKVPGMRPLKRTYGESVRDFMEAMFAPGDRGRVDVLPGRDCTLPLGKTPAP